jgi:hypothetical protein
MKRFKDYDVEVQTRALINVAEMTETDKADSALDFIRERCPQNIQDAFTDWNLEWAAFEENVRYLQENDDE